MMIRVEQRLTVSEFLDEMHRRFGGIEELRRYVRRHPRDATSRQDLEDFEFYRGHPELRLEQIERAVSLIPVTDEALSAFTSRRLALLDTLALRKFDSVRQLAGHLGRDVHNVHEDLQLFRKLGLVAFEKGPRNRRIPKLVADSITVIAGRAPVTRFDTRPGGRPFAHADESHEP